MPKLPPPEPVHETAAPEGRYRIATVAELTGVPEPTLRAWERRYGVPSPERTAAGYRLYGEADIRVVREMKRLSGEGVSAAEAARLVLQPGAPAPTGPAAAPAHDAFRLATDAILDAIDRFDDVALDRQLRRLLFLGSASELVEHVVSPVLVVVGERCHAGELSVAQEHLATQKLGTVMRDLVRILPGSDASEAALLACFADDEHELGLLGVAIQVAEWGLRPVFLGARTPPLAVRSAVKALSPRFVALSVTVTPPGPRARELVEDYARACGSVPWIVGGAGAAAISGLVQKRGGIVIPDERPVFENILRSLVLSPRSRTAERSRP